MVTSKSTMIFSRLAADFKATGFSRYVVYFYHIFWTKNINDCCLKSWCAKQSLGEEDDMT
jgi:hypothetical protein